MIDLNAPIIPHVGAGGIKLYSKRDSLEEILNQDYVTSKILNHAWIRYDIGDSLELFFHLKNNKLFRITTLEQYRGTLFGSICVGMKREEFLKLEPSFHYDEFEEVFESEKGVFIETDAINNTAKWISVYIKEMDTAAFDMGNW